MAELKKLEQQPITLYGLQNGNSIVLHQFYVLPEDREVTIDALMETLMDNAIVTLGTVLIRTERFDSFKVV